MVHTFYDNKSKGGGVDTQAKQVQRTYENDQIKQNQRPLDMATQLAKELRKPIITSFKKRAVYWRFKDNTWGADLKFYCALLISFKDKKDVSIADAFQKILDESRRKPSKIWVNKGREFYNNSFK